MAFTVNFYRFSKRTNSTKRPADGDMVTTKQCVLLDTSSIQAPQIRLDQSGAEQVLTSNYAFIPLYSRYYFIDNWTFDGPFMTASLQVDTLATWRDTIGGSSEYVVRSSATFNTNVADNQYPMTAETSVVRQTKETSWEPLLENGTYIMGVAGNSGTRYYALTHTQFLQFFRYLYSDDYANQIVAGFATAFPTLKAQVNPIQYISSVTWLPVKYTGVAVDNVLVGWGIVPVSCNYLDTTVAAFTATFTDLARHPQSSRGNYLNCSPYSEYSLYFPPFGEIPLNAERIANSTYIDVAGVFDVRTGTATMRVSCGPEGNSYYPLAAVQGRIGIPIQVSQITGGQYGVGNAVLDVTKGAIAVGTGNLAGAFSTIADMVTRLTGTTSTVGSTGGMESLRGYAILTAVFHHIANEDNAHLGRPLCQRVQLSTIPGYIQVDEADISIPGTAAENEQIKSHLEGGFFYE